MKTWKATQAPLKRQIPHPQRVDNCVIKLSLVGCRTWSGILRYHCSDSAGCILLGELHASLEISSHTEDSRKSQCIFPVPVGGVCCQNQHFVTVMSWGEMWEGSYHAGAGGGGEVVRLPEGTSREAAIARQRPVLPARGTVKYHRSDVGHLMSRDWKL